MSAYQPLDKPSALILAAGTSSRMGQPKLLLDWNGVPVLEQTIRNVQAVVDEVIVVTGAYSERTTAIAEVCSASVAHNIDYAKGEMISSLQAGLHALGNPTGFMVMLGDMPLVQPETMQGLIDKWQQVGGIVAPTFEGRQGHPVIFSAEFIPELLALPWNQTPRRVIQANHSQLHRVPVETQSVLIDLDTPESYARWRPKN